MFKVIFTYDEPSRKWVPTVEGAKDELEARQGFAAVVLTVHRLNPHLLNHTIIVKSETDYKVTPVV